MQERLRKMVKIAKFQNDDIYYKDFAEFLQISEHGFYNQLNGYYDLSEKKARKLEGLLVDMIE